jgi:pSer/pThr/pTyr-binding forkhead associated (FHA) protein
MPELLLESSVGTRSALRLHAGKRWLIGTDPRCSLKLPPGTAEPFHCEVFYSSLQWQVRDLLSASGTLVGGKAAHQQPLASGDVIQVGREQLTFVLEEQETAVGHLSASSAGAARPRKTIQRASARARTSASVACGRSSATRTFVASLALVVGLAAVIAVLSGVFGTRGTSGAPPGTIETSLEAGRRPGADRVRSGSGGASDKSTSALPCVREQLTRGRVQSRFGES